MVTKAPDMKRMALEYARRKWPVFPLHNPTPAGQCSCAKVDCASMAKHPRTPNGLKDASLDPAVISAWWQRWPDANIGVVTGRSSGLVVLDLDVKADGPRRWGEMEDIHGRTDTLTSMTGSGGQHWIFEAPSEPLGNSAGKLAPGIDTRAEGGYIVAPPSLHICGQRYEWDHRQPPIPVPEWLLAIWPRHHLDIKTADNGHPTPPLGDQPHWVTDSLAGGAPEGTRNATAHRLAGYFRSKGIPRDVIAQVMAEFGERCTPPMNVRELYQTIDSAQRYAVQVAAAGISDPPLMEETGDSVTYSWEIPGVNILVEHLHRNSLGVQCEVTVTSQGAGVPKGMHGPVHYNLTSTSGRETLVRYLGKRWEIDWAEILETLTRLTVARLRMGEPTVDLRESMHRPLSQWAMRPLLLEEGPTIMFGPGGTGKSLIGLAMMLSLNTGQQILPGLIPGQSHKGLYADWEDTKYTHGTRMRQLLAGAGMDAQAQEQYYVKCVGGLEDNVGHLRQKIDSLGITYIIIDSAAYACGGEPDKVEFAMRFFGAYQRLGVPALIIAHQTKDSKAQMPFGSVAWHNSARATWEVKHQQTAGDGAITIGLFHRKANNSELYKPLAFRLSFGLDEIIIAKADLAKSTELSKELPMADRIASLLQEGPSTVVYLAEMLEKPEATIKTTLYRYKDRFIQSPTSSGPPQWTIRGEE